MKSIIFVFTAITLSFTLNAQHLIKGKVTDESGLSLVGVNVVEKNTNTGTSSDINGSYVLEVSAPDAIIVLSYTGYKSQELNVNNAAIIEVVLEEGLLLGEIKIVGTRNSKRSVTDSPVAIDVIDVAELASESGKVEINQILQYAAPSFNATKQSGSDGADHIDPASLRGLGPDQTLVLINGKRRHQSSLVNVFGTRGRGNTGTDLNAIPAAAIKRIEVLRDGASAQYGSDAIAGVINIVLKDVTDGVSAGVTYGAYSTDIGEDYPAQISDQLFNIDGKNRLDGEEKSYDGNTFKIDLNYGASLGQKGGFINLTTEYLQKDRTLRPGFEWRKGYGSAAIEQFQFMTNAAIPLSPNTEFYTNAGRGFRETDAYAFSRSAPGEDGDSRAVASLYPNGFTPRITSNIVDQSISAGVRHSLDNSWTADFGHTYGYNNFHYYIKGTNNASLGTASPTEFDAGGHSAAMHVTNLDFSKYFKNILAGINLAFGTEYRNENFKILAGEEGSYATYDENGLAISNPATQIPFTNQFDQQSPGGSQGFPGYSPSNTVDKNRSNYGLYGDAEVNISERFLLAAAMRYENYSDFGNTFNFKAAVRYNIIDGLAARASVSTGFRAPSLTQIHYNLVFNNIIAGRSERTLLAANTSTVAKQFGIEPLKEETAQNAAIGFTYSKNGFTATVDAYQINVDDRIILTDVFDASSLNVGADAAQFFANGVNTETQGIDFVLNYQYRIDDNSTFSAGLTGNFNNTTIVNINSGNLNEFTFFGPFSQAYLQAAAPDYKIGINANYSFAGIYIAANYTLFSEVMLQDFQWVDTPATTATEAAALYTRATDTYDSAGTLDISLGFQIIDPIKLTLGVNNLLNTYPTPQFDGWTDQGGFNDSVQMGSDGRYVFGRLGFNF